MTAFNSCPTIFEERNDVYCYLVFLSWKIWQCLLGNVQVRLLKGVCQCIASGAFCSGQTADQRLHAGQGSPHLFALLTTCWGLCWHCPSVCLKGQQHLKSSFCDISVAFKALCPSRTQLHLTLTSPLQRLANKESSNRLTGLPSYKVVTLTSSPVLPFSQ